MRSHTSHQTKLTQMFTISLHAAAASAHAVMTELVMPHALDVSQLDAVLFSSECSSSSLPSSSWLLHSLDYWTNTSHGGTHLLHFSSKFLLSLPLLSQFTSSELTRDQLEANLEELLSCQSSQFSSGLFGNWSSSLPSTRETLYTSELELQMMTQTTDNMERNNTFSPSLLKLSLSLDSLPTSLLSSPNTSLWWTLHTRREKERKLLKKLLTVTENESIFSD